jgi:hypothetical protein
VLNPTNQAKDEAERQMSLDDGDPRAPKSEKRRRYELIAAFIFLTIVAVVLVTYGDQLRALLR